LIVDKLKEYKLAGLDFSGARVVIEKPFGRDLGEQDAGERWKEMVEA